MMKYTKVYLCGGTSGKSDPTDYIIGYLAESGKYIDKRTSAFDSDVWYEVDGFMFDTLRAAKSYCERKGVA